MGGPENLLGLRVEAQGLLEEPVEGLPETLAEAEDGGQIATKAHARNTLDIEGHD